MTEFPETKSDLLLRIQSAEDREAWDQFVSMYRPVIYRMARRRGLQDADAQDLVQRVLIAVAGAIGQWKPTRGARFRHWLRRVTKNAALNALTRLPKDRGQGGTDASDLLSNEMEHTPEQNQGFDLEARRECFHRAATMVQSEVRGNSWDVFQLTVIEGLPAKDAAQKLGMSVGGVYAAQGRVMDRLRRVVTELEEME